MPSAVFLFVLPQIWGLMAVWLGLTLVMTLRMGAGFWRYVPYCPELFWKSSSGTIMKQLQTWHLYLCGALSLRILAWVDVQHIGVQQDWIGLFVLLMSSKLGFVLTFLQVWCIIRACSLTLAYFSSQGWNSNRSVGLPKGWYWDQWSLE